jgi:hypothetical protein
MRGDTGSTVFGEPAILRGLVPPGLAVDGGENSMAIDRLMNDLNKVRSLPVRGAVLAIDGLNNGRD